MRNADVATGFSERAFYLREFRGRSIAFAGVPGGWPTVASGALASLRDGGGRAIVFSDATQPTQDQPLSEEDPHLEVAVWRALRDTGRAEVAFRAGAQGHAARAAELALRLKVFKWVWLDPEGGLIRNGRPASFVDGEELARGLEVGGALAGDPRRSLWEAIARALTGGIPAVNVCTAEGLDDELFTYAGSGTLFTPGRYITVRHLGVDDYDAASDLLGRGVSEGYLAPRDPSARDGLLVRGFGAFIGATHLAGIGSLIDWGEGQAAEIAGLYTLTRFQGEGIGGHLVAFAAEQARKLPVRRLFACTTSGAVGAFFERQGFQEVAAESLPADKWNPPNAEAYDPTRRAELHCFALDLGEG
jgi:N-acetylglutamate synthase-like GNAT family acetyltransferase